MDPAEAVLQEKALKFMCSMPRSLWLGCSSLADSMPSLRCLYNPGTGALTAFQNSSEREDCNNGEPPRKIIPEKNSLRQLEPWGCKAMREAKKLTK
ncbi:F-box/WD repeat-containing protein 1A-like [Leptonychotes weddellii]|uniref:F-box/WD repeat-containing protein 1A-like n=1 Tax=Leptonychotes weddellii TaxID=9713 RepID=A0A7F8QJW8_LEPWE|nr:F-box/WD repeat-containing protein 1A-like [Leptonychotes weddellii]